MLFELLLITAIVFALGAGCGAGLILAAHRRGMLNR